MSLRFSLILSSHLCLGLPSGLFLSGLPIKILYEFVICPMSVDSVVKYISERQHCVLDQYQ